MTQLTDVFQPSTLALINRAISEGTGPENSNNLAAYNAISHDLSVYAAAHPGVIDPGTLYWFSQAGLVNSSLYDENPAGTYIRDFTKAAAASEGATITDQELQNASDVIAKTVFEQLQNGLFDTTAFSPTEIVSKDAGEGIGYLQSLFPSANLDYAMRNCRCRVHHSPACRVHLRLAPGQCR